MIIEGDESTKSEAGVDHQHHHHHHNNLNTQKDLHNKTFDSYQDKSFNDFSKSSWSCIRCCFDKNKKSKYYEKKSKYKRLSYYRNNMSFFIVILVYILISSALVAIQLYLYKDANPGLKAARVGGILLNFNCSLIILLVLRRLLTWIRNSAIGTNFLPLDDFIKFHKFIGIFLFVLTVEHTVGHMFNLCKILIFYGKKISSTPNKILLPKNKLNLP